MQREYEVCLSEGKKNNMIINKCWNVIRQICEMRQFVIPYCDQMEKVLAPLLLFMKTPEAIEFDDDILLVVGAFIRLKKQITGAARELFPHLPLFFQKYR